MLSALGAGSGVAWGPPRLENPNASGDVRRSDRTFEVGTALPPRCAAAPWPTSTSSPRRPLPQNTC